VSDCQPCEQGKHKECYESFWQGSPDLQPCTCPCQSDPNHATDEKLMWADLRRKEGKENG
jgi:hypothetical protein